MFPVCPEQTAFAALFIVKGYLVGLMSEIGAKAVTLYESSKI